MSKLEHRRRLSFVLLIACLTLLLGACSASRPVPPPDISPGVRRATQRPYTINGRTYYPLASADGYREKGLASWYGKPFHGRKTACGETYDMYEMTAAHRTLPLGTQVRVTNLRNDRQVLLRVNDRGPFVQGRIIDLSFAAAKKLKVVGPGTAPVVVEAVGRPAAPGGRRPTTKFRMGPLAIQVGSFAEKANAARLADRINNRFGPGAAWVDRFDDGVKVWHRVRAFDCPDRACAQTRARELLKAGFGSGFIVARD